MTTRKKSLDAQMSNRERARAYHIKKRRDTYYFYGLVLLIVIIFMIAALCLGQGEFAKDLAKMLLVFAAGAVSGFQYERRRESQDC